MHSWHTMASSAVLFLALALAACAGGGAVLFRGSRARTNPIRRRGRKRHNPIRLATLAAAVVTTACGGGGGGGLSPSSTVTSGTAPVAPSSFAPVAAPPSAGVTLNGSNGQFPASGSFPVSYAALSAGGAPLSDHDGMATITTNGSTSQEIVH